MRVCSADSVTVRTPMQPPAITIDSLCPSDLTLRLSSCRFHERIYPVKFQNSKKPFKIAKTIENDAFSRT